ncbi:MAG: hypothetical protein MUE72_04670 [Chitinophagaceae bacterium]|nr:hypothetical protein [Chitinophagaceae bacterium]
MKNLLRNFKWSTFFAYAIVFGIISILADWAFGKFKEPNFVLYRYVISFSIKIIIFGFFMALIVKPKDTNSSNSNS